MQAWGGEAGKGQCQGEEVSIPSREGGGGPVSAVSQMGGWKAPAFAADPTLPRAQRTERRAPKKMGSSAMSRRLP